MADTITLTGSDLSLDGLRRIVAGAPVGLDPAGPARMARTRKVIDAAVAARQPVYGVTTGLGPKATEPLPATELEAFALRTVRGRAHGAGADLAQPICRATLAIRANTLLTGAAGARPELAALMADCLNAGLAPAMREAGSVGAADLVWGGEFGLALIGEGRMHAGDGIRPAGPAMAQAGLSPWKPGPREGLALVSHTAPSAAIAALAVTACADMIETAQTAAALSLEAFRGNLSILDEEALALRPQPGQAEAAAGLRRRLQGSLLWKPAVARRLQDPLSLRNLAQIHGAALAALAQAREAVEIEINGASDNPAVLAGRGEVISHGGYMTTHLAIVLGSLAQAQVHLIAAQVARMGKLLSGRFSGLENGLTGLGVAGAGLAPLMKTAEALFAEIARDAAPAPAYPGFSADGLEDVVSHAGPMGLAVQRIAGRLAQLNALELIVAAQAVELRGDDAGLGAPMRQVFDAVRSASLSLTDDRAMGEDIARLADLVREGRFVQPEADE